MAVNLSTLSRALLVASAVALIPAAGFAQTTTSGTTAPTTAAVPNTSSNPSSTSTAVPPANAVPPASAGKTVAQPGNLADTPAPANKTMKPITGTETGSSNLPPATSADSQQAPTPKQVKPVKKGTHKATAASVAKSAARNKAIKAKPEPGNATATSPSTGD